MEVADSPLLPSPLCPFRCPHALLSPPALPAGTPRYPGQCQAPQCSSPSPRCLAAPLGFAPTEELSLQTSVWPRFGCRTLPVPFSAVVIICSSCRCCFFLSLQLVGELAGSSGEHRRACSGAKQPYLGLVQQVSWGKSPLARCRDAGQVIHLAEHHQGNNPLAAPACQVKPLPGRAWGNTKPPGLGGVTWG